MKVEIHCLECKNTYLCGSYTTKIHGPVFKTACPVCGTEVIKNFSAFLSDQTPPNPKLKKIGDMIRLGRAVAGIINERAK